MLTLEKAQQYLHSSLGSDLADFRDGQFEAINLVVNQKKKLLVVQKTGWGKSSVYFISTKYIREQGGGVSIIISPLLALMRNQIMSANKLNLNVVTINSSNKEDWDDIKCQILSNQIDALLISPERLSNSLFMKEIFEPISSNIGLFVIDEAHCISDWGHDFRPDYKKITNIIKKIPNNTPILATTATANNRVIADISEQIQGIITLRGSLRRDSLILHKSKILDSSHRLAWLIEHLEKFNGSGIIYVLTQRDAKQVAEFLNQNNISARAYYSDISDNDRISFEDALINNKIKALVATSALGMGFDKSDLSFVVHYQAPSSIISYYQQVGRAGRGIDKAYGILLSGHEDDDIHNFFRTSSIPSKENIDSILNLLDNNDGLSNIDIQTHLNFSQFEIEKTLKYLSVQDNPPIVKRNSQWLRTVNQYVYDEKKIKELISMKEIEWQEMQEYLETNSCLMVFLQKSLNDTNLIPCGKCGNCKQPMKGNFSIENGIKATNFLKKNYIDFEPKKQVKQDALIIYGIKGNIAHHLRAENGKILARWRDAGWGNMIADDKLKGVFSDALVDAFVKMIQEWRISIQWVTCVPSLNNPNLVVNFSQKVANKLNIPFYNIVKKIKNNIPQKMMNNSYLQAKNLSGVFEIQGTVPKDPVLLIDDIIDSGWTITAISALLKQNGADKIYPASLATTGKM